MRKLVFGCGYLGYRVARRWCCESLVTVVTRRAARATELAAEGFETIVADVTRPETLPRLTEYDSVLFAIGYDRSAGASIESVYVDGLAAVLDRWDGPPARFLYISSTGVYGDAFGAIDEGTAEQPTRDGGRACLAAEQTLARHPVAANRIVLRLAGIYGPGRLPRRADLLAGRPIAAAPHGQLNLIHVEDAVEVVLAAEVRARPPALYIVSDGSPVERRAYYEYAAELLGTPPPVFTASGEGSPRAERATGPRHLRNEKMLRELGISLRYPTYREGLHASLL